MHMPFPGRPEVPEPHRARDPPLDVRIIHADEILDLRPVALNHRDGRRHLLRRPKSIFPMGSSRHILYLTK